MIKSVWRNSHFLLAIFSSFFLLIASITGGLLALEPIINKTKPYQIFNTDRISIAQTIDKLKIEYAEIYAIKNEKKGHIIVKYSEGKFYVNPISGELLGKTKKQTSFFKYLTKLHRSLFLKTTGRFIVGIVSFLLFLIAITGTLLILKRQKGIKAFFEKIIKESSEQFYHIVFGRITLIPIIVLALSGTFLSLQRFQVISKEKFKLNPLDQSELVDKTVISITDFTVFKDYSLDNLIELKFPFSSNVNDFFYLKLTDRELLINQFSGKIVSEHVNSFTKNIFQISFDLHTGYSGVIWSFVLLVSAFSIPYFMYSGFMMSYKRLKGGIKNKYKTNDCEYIILIGSENGSTQCFAKMLYKGFLEENKKVFIATLNNYEEFPKMRHLIVLSATYGNGEAPSKASRFLKKIEHRELNNHSFYFSVIGFGSLLFPKFCQFAIDVDIALHAKKSANEFLALQTVNNKSFVQFSQWMRLWNAKTQFNIFLDRSIIKRNKKQQNFTIVSRKVDENCSDGVFMLELIPVNKKRYFSGDLLGVSPDQKTHERLYSVAEINNKICLIVKLHQKGLCSNYLYKATVGSVIKGYLHENTSFYFPKKASKVIMIAAGTGIAPFLGMIYNNDKLNPVDLYFGVRTKKSLYLYADFIYKALQCKKISKFYPAYSREFDEKMYVQHLIKKDISMIVKSLENNAVIMICGSVSMQKGVFDILEERLINSGKSIKDYKKAKQILVDCY